MKTNTHSDSLTKNVENDKLKWNPINEEISADILLENKAGRKKRSKTTKQF